MILQMQDAISHIIISTPAICPISKFVYLKNYDYRSEQIPYMSQYSYGAPPHIPCPMMSTQVLTGSLSEVGSAGGAGGANWLTVVWWRCGHKTVAGSGSVARTNTAHPGEASRPLFVFW
jgi:hypothetical protein